MPIDLPGPIWFVVTELPSSGSPSDAVARNLLPTAEGTSPLFIWTEGTGFITSRADQRQPSLGGSFWAAPQRFPRLHRPACRMCPTFRACALPPPKPASDRSEERRVGKEGGWRGSRTHIHQ